MKWWKRIALGFLGFIFLGAIGVYVYMQGLGDVRTDYAIEKGTSANAQKKGRALLGQSIAKLGGTASWKRLQEQAMKVTFQHDWHNTLLRTFFMPIEFSGQRLSLLLKPRETSARLTFLDGQWKNKIWGIHQGKTYQIDASGKFTWKENKTARFHVPGYRFFFFMPFYLAEAELITYAGTRKCQGNDYHLIYATWGKWSPQKNVDQYLLWINQKTLMIDFVQSTVRDMNLRSIVSLSLTKYQDVLGVKLPFSLKILQDINVMDAGMHHIKVLDVQQVKSDVSRLLYPAHVRKNAN